HASKKTIQELPPVGEKASLHIVHIFRQDDQLLCGFSTRLEREWFQLLISVQGVGVRVALSILSILSPDELADCIARQYPKPLTQAEGVGAKVANRITLELKGKIPTDHDFIDTINSKSHSRFAIANHTLDDTISALLNLGYTKNDATQATQKAIADNPTAPTQDIIRQALKNLSQGIR
ncbi:MAG: Holliday junction branch migration protein RuvA, partial [Alphaproteobacteria bacterium]|nr:Holliday junction branch migration protein RuvA [Alphaproteobacteria bacterium]